MHEGRALYDDGRIACDDRGLVVRWYYLWGAKRIPYSTIRSVSKRPMNPARGKWRIWGSGDFVHWYNLDGTRPGKTVELELDTGGTIRPVITPDEPDKVAAIIGERTSV